LQKVLHNKKQSVELLVIGITSPLLVGVYENSLLIETFKSEEKTSKALPKILYQINDKYSLTKLYYAKGPGSFMAIKVTYVMLKTFSIAMNIPLFACDAFFFNDNKPIKAVGKSYFVKEDKKIIIKKGYSFSDMAFKLPDSLDKTIFDTNSEPLYILPAV